MVRVTKATLGDIVKRTGQGAKAVNKARALVPILEEEDLHYHVDQLLAENKYVREAVEQKPYLRKLLKGYMRRTLQDYEWAIYGAKTVDSIDKVAAVIELGAGMFGPQAEVGAKAVAEMVEGGTKVPYLAYYVTKSGDLVALPYFGAMEAASLVPYVGQAVDFKNLYLERLRKHMRKETAKSFLENIVNNQVVLA